MVGLFINTVPVRVRVRPGESLERPVARIQDRAGRSHRAPAPGLAEIQRQAGVGELFDTVTVFVKLPVDPHTEYAPAAGLRVVPVGGEGGDTTHYPLSLNVSPRTAAAQAGVPH